MRRKGDCRVSCFSGNFSGEITFRRERHFSAVTVQLGGSKNRVRGWLADDPKRRSRPIVHPR